MSDESSPLAGVRVVDLATSRAEMAGRLLADQGAQVLKIEPPGGAEARHRLPLDESRGRGAGESLYWSSVALGKRSAVLDLDEAQDRGRLRALLLEADVLIESFDPGTLSRLGLGYEATARENPRLIFASITPYGQQGPKSAWPATELTLEAAGGRVALQGDPDRPPLPLGLPHAAFHAGAQAAADIVIALNERELSGRGQHLDTSMQECMVWTLMGPYGWAVAEGRDPPGTGDDRREPENPTAIARLFPRLCECADGWVAVSMSPLGQSRGGGLLPCIMRELRAEGRLDKELQSVDWDSWDEAFFAGELGDELVEMAVKRVEDVLRSRSKAELVRFTIENKLRLGAVRTTRDLLEDEHFESRGFFCDVDGRRHPGSPIRVSFAKARSPRPAPALGEGQALVDEWTRGSRKESVHAADSERPDERLGEAFAGLKVADFSWVVAGPTMGKALADHGATVVRVESSRRPDLARRLPPFKDGVEGLNRGQWAAMYNTSKLSLAVDLSMPEGQELARRLVRWADVVIESFSPGTMERLGLGWDDLSQGRSDLIMMSTSLFGSGGPLSPFVGFGQQAAAMVGLHAITGWPDRPPCGPFGPYTDVIAPKFGVCALAAAILDRRSTGKGRHLEMAQAETGIRFIEPLVLDESVNGRTAVARGMRSDLACPHGVYAASGTERYVALAVETAAHWRALRSVAPLEGFEATALDELGARLAVRKDLESEVSAWCAGQEPEILEARLVAAGVPASIVQRPTDLMLDPQLEHRGFRQILDHAELGPMPYDGLATHFSAKKTMLHRPTPCLGQHTREVLADLLQLTPAEILRLDEAGVLE
jgi:crotonobetainyl-CoA:carnitine CoA-transferase CaiB-like acyl-CoA transferase